MAKWKFGWCLFNLLRMGVQGTQFFDHVLTDRKVICKREIDATVMGTCSLYPNIKIYFSCNLPWGQKLTGKKFYLARSSQVGQMKGDKIFNLPRKNLNAGPLSMFTTTGKYLSMFTTTDKYLSMFTTTDEYLSMFTTTDEYLSMFMITYSTYSTIFIYPWRPGIKASFTFK